MTPLDRDSPTIRRTNTLSRGQATCTMYAKGKTIEFSSVAIALLNAKDGQYLHAVLIEPYRLAFYVNDKENGYKLFNITNNRLKCYATVLVTQIVHEMNNGVAGEGMKFKLQLAPEKYNDQNIYELVRL